MNSIPNDPVMLLSFVNTRLRDEFDDLEDLCAYYEISPKDIDKKLNELGYVYNSENKQYI
ncbi:MAG: DUF4250 domain-containing protein [Eubacteriales bacterium]|nr:DUF4250 domain-containing protein [Eubacteriales bacterium]